MFRSLAITSLAALAASQAPQSSDREDEGEECSHAERDERPDPEEFSAGVDDPAPDESRPSHVGEGHDRTKERSEEGDDVPRSPSGEHERSVHPDDEHEYPADVSEPSRLKPADDVVREVKRREQNREERRDG